MSRSLSPPQTYPDPSEIYWLGESSSGDRRVRDQLVWTAGIAGTLILLLAVAGIFVASSGWYETVDVAVWVAAGCVAVTMAAAVRTALLFRALPPPAPIRSSLPSEDRNSLTDTGPLSVVPWSLGPAEFAAATNGERVEQRPEVFGKLSHRLQSLVNRLISKIDAMEHEIEDPDLLNMLWGIDHLATLVRRQTENIAVLGGEALQRRSDSPVDVNAVMRSAVAEIQQYRQVTMIPIADAAIHGHVVAEVIHLLSELLDNATTFTPDDGPKVALRARYVSAGLEIQVEDRGLGMEYDDIDRINRLLEGSTHVDVGQLLQDGRIGLAVVKELARRHGIAVRLQPNIYGGVDASIVVPRELLDPQAMSVGAGRRVSATRRAAGLSAPTGTSSRPVASTQHRTPTPAREPTATIAAVHAPSQPTAPPVPPGPRRHSDHTSGGPHDEPDRRGVPASPDNGRPPALPTRRRDAAMSALPSGPDVGEPAAADTTADAAPDSAAGAARPALPQRRAQPSHLRPELLAPAAPVRPIPDANLDLMADLRSGRERGQAELSGDERRVDIPGADATADQVRQPNQPPIDPHTQGDPSRWPTI